MYTVDVQTPNCLVCGEYSIVRNLERTAVSRWHNGESIQSVFGHLSPAERELLITGTHDWCWNEMMGEY